MLVLPGWVMSQFLLSHLWTVLLWYVLLPWKGDQLSSIAVSGLLTPTGISRHLIWTQPILQLLHANFLPSLDRQLAGLTFTNLAPPSFLLLMAGAGP